MAIISTEYSIELLSTAPHSTAETESDVVGLVDGTYAAVGTLADQVRLEVRTVDGAQIGTVALNGTDGAVTQLANGNIVVSATALSGGINYLVFTLTGEVVGEDTNIGASSDDTNSDLAALANGGFVIVNQRAFGATDNDIRVYVRDATGAAVTSLVVDTTGENDRNPSVAGLTGGGFAVAFERVAADGSTQIWTAVYNADGTVRKAPTLFDAFGTINASPSLTALPDGGFAIAYQDDGFEGSQPDIAYARFDSAGDFSIVARASDDTDTDSEASVTTLSNGIGLVTYTNNVNNGGDLDILPALYDPATGVLTGADALGAIIGDSDATLDSSVSALGLARFVVGYTNATDNTVEQRVYQLVRTTTGDDGLDEFIGDDAVDIVNGNGGDDFLQGLANDDTLNGGDGIDLLFGGEGEDRLNGGDDLDILDGGAGSDTLNGDDGNDTLVGGAGADQMFGGSDDDDFFVSGSEVTGDTIDGGAGSDTILIRDDAGAETRLDQAIITGIEEIAFNTSNRPGASATILATQIGVGIPDNLLVSGNNIVASIFRVEMGAEAIVDLSGFTFQNFTPTDPSKSDRFLVLGDNDAEFIVGTGIRDELYGSGGDDTLTGGGGGDYLSGGLGSDTAFYANAGAGVTVSLANPAVNTGEAAGDTFNSIENLTGSAFADTLTGNGAANTLIGGAGADGMSGGSNDDTFIVSGSETTGDTIDGGTGSDRILVTDQLGADTRLDQTTVAGIEEVEFAANASSEMSLTILAAQVGAGISSTLLIDGNGAGVAERFRVEMGADNSVDLSGFTFQDFATSGGGDDRLIVLGDNDAESITGTGIRDELYGSGGDDVLEGRGGGDYLSGGLGIDTASYANAGAGVTVSLANASINTGEAAGDTFNSIENLTGSAFNDTLTGNGAANTLIGGAGADGMSGGGGDDTFIVSGSETTGDTIDGEAGSDRILVTDGFAFDTRLDQTTIAGIEEIEFSAGNKAETSITIRANQVGAGISSTLLIDGSGTGLINRFRVEMGADTSVNLSGFTFQDFATSGGGDDRLIVLGDNDAESILGTSIRDELFGSGGNDTLGGGRGGDYLSGGLGTDTATYSTAGSGVTASLSNAAGNTGDAAGDTYNSIENLTGSAFADQLTGNGGANTIRSGVGNDTLAGLGGNDTLNGGSDNDTLSGGAGADMLQGGTGSDLASYADATAGVVASLANAATNTGEAAGDTYNSIERLTGSAFNDTLTGANAVNNTLRGGAGNDTLNGLTGSDALEGGLGNDTFVFNTALNAATNVDTILDFSNVANTNDDRFLLDDAIFAGISGDLANGGLLLSGFYKNITTGAQDANDRILYRQSTGELIYDSNGLTAGGQTVFAKVTINTPLSFADFFVN